MVRDDQRAPGRAAHPVVRAADLIVKRSAASLNPLGAAALRVRGGDLLLVLADARAHIGDAGRVGERGHQRLLALDHSLDLARLSEALSAEAGCHLAMQFL